MASALLEAASARRRDLQVHLFGARSLWGPDRPLLLDDASLAILTAHGIPLPPGQRLDGILNLHGGRTAALPASFRVLPRNRLVVILRSLLHAQGTILSERRVSAVSERPGGGYIVRADGASLPVDAVVLACGAGAELGLSIRGHRPPPTTRAFGAHFNVAPTMPNYLRRRPLKGGGDLCFIPARDGAAALLLGSKANARELGRQLLAEALRDPAAAWGSPESFFSFWLPEGLARPSLPSLGNALGGSPSGPGLHEVFDQAERIAAALLDEGVEEATAISRSAAKARRPIQRREERAAARMRRFPIAARERALRTGFRARLPSPAQRSLAGEAIGFWQAVWAFFLLLWAWVLASLVPRPSPRRSQSRPRRELFVVEDDPAQAEALSAFLRERGFSCRTFSDAMQAIRAAAKVPPAALVLDLALPWVDGLEALRAIRHSWLRDTPVFVASALPRDEGALRGKRPLVGAWLEKPLDLEQLVRHLDALPGLSQSRARQLLPSDLMADDR